MAGSTLKAIDFKALMKRFDQKFDIDAVYAKLADGAVEDDDIFQEKVVVAKVKKSGAKILNEMLSLEISKISDNVQLYKDQLTGFRDAAKKECDAAEALLKKAGKKVTTKVIGDLDGRLDAINDMVRKAEKLSKLIDAYLPTSYSELAALIKKRGLSEFEYLPTLKEMKKAAIDRGFEDALISRAKEYADRAAEFKKTALKLHQSELIESEQKSLKKSGDKDGLSKITVAAVALAKEEMQELQTRANKVYAEYVKHFTIIQKELKSFGNDALKKLKSDDLLKAEKSLVNLSGVYKTLRGTMKTYDLLVSALKTNIKANEALAKTDAGLKDLCKSMLKDFQANADLFKDEEKSIAKHFAEAEKQLAKLKKAAGIK